MSYRELYPHLSQLELDRSDSQVSEYRTANGEQETEDYHTAQEYDINGTNYDEFRSNVRVHSSQIHNMEDNARALEATIRFEERERLLEEARRGMEEARAFRVHEEFRPYAGEATIQNNRDIERETQGFMQVAGALFSGDRTPFMDLGKRGPFNPYNYGQRPYHPSTIYVHGGGSRLRPPSLNKPLLAPTFLAPPTGKKGPNHLEVDLRDYELDFTFKNAKPEVRKKIEEECKKYKLKRLSHEEVKIKTNRGSYRVNLKELGPYLKLVHGEKFGALNEEEDIYKAIELTPKTEIAYYFKISHLLPTAIQPQMSPARSFESLINMEQATKKAPRNDDWAQNGKSGKMEEDGTRRHPPTPRKRESIEMPPPPPYNVNWRKKPEWGSVQSPGATEIQRPTSPAFEHLQYVPRLTVSRATSENSEEGAKVETCCPEGSIYRRSLVMQMGIVYLILDHLATALRYIMPFEAIRNALATGWAHPFRKTVEGLTSEETWRILRTMTDEELTYMAETMGFQKCRVPARELWEGPIGEPLRRIHAGAGEEGAHNQTGAHSLPVPQNAQADQTYPQHAPPAGQGNPTQDGERGENPQEVDMIEVASNERNIVADLRRQYEGGGGCPYLTNSPTVQTPRRLIMTESARGPGARKRTRNQDEERSLEEIEREYTAASITVTGTVGASKIATATKEETKELLGKMSQAFTDVLAVVQEQKKLLETLQLNGEAQGLQFTEGGLKLAIETTIREGFEKYAEDIRRKVCKEVTEEMKKEMRTMNGKFEEVKKKVVEVREACGSGGGGKGVQDKLEAMTKEVKGLKANVTKEVRGLKSSVLPGKTVKTYADKLKENRERNDPEVIKMVIRSTEGKEANEVKEKVQEVMEPREADVKVNKVNNVKGGILVEVKTKNKEETKKMLVEKVKDQNMEVKEIEKTVMLRLGGLSTTTDEAKLMKEIAANLREIRNEEISDESVQESTKLVKEWTVKPSPNSQRKRESKVVILRVTGDYADSLADKVLYIGWDKCVAKEYVEAYLCLKCGAPGHSKDSCERPKVCFKCGKEDHERKDCKEKEFNCVNCVRDKKKETKHSPYSKDCPTYKRELDWQVRKLRWGWREIEKKNDG